MLKGRSRDPRGPANPTHLAGRPPAKSPLPSRAPIHQTATLPRAPLARPEPDYEVVEFPNDQYMNAKLQAPPPPPPRPVGGHPLDAVASCGLCGGGDARVRCAECGRRALCASCDDMYHRHPKRRHHQRQAISTPAPQIREIRPPLPPKGTPPVPPPRRHKLGDRSSASPRPPGAPGLDHRRATLGHLSLGNSGLNTQHQIPPHLHSALNSHGQQIPPHLQSALNNHNQQIPPHLQGALAPRQQPAPHMGSMPYLPTSVAHAAAINQPHLQPNNLGHLAPAWGQHRGSLQGFNVHPNMQLQQPIPMEAWESPESLSPSGHASPWGQPMRRGASVLDLGAPAGCAGCAHCGPPGWRYGSHHSLAWPQSCCMPHPGPHGHPHSHHHMHPSQTPQPYRRAESRAVSRTGSRAGSRAASPAMSARSRASRRTKHRTPSPSLPSSDADSESESDPPPRAPASAPPPKPARVVEEVKVRAVEEVKAPGEPDEDSLGPPPPPPSASWHCEHCTFVNEPGVRVCVVCCRTPTTEAKIITDEVSEPMSRLNVAVKSSPSPIRSDPVPVVESSRSNQNGEIPKKQQQTKQTKERASTGCGPSPPREIQQRKPTSRLCTPTKDQDRFEPKVRHDMAIGPSPPRDQITKHSIAIGSSPARESLPRASPYREIKPSPQKQSISVGLSPPRSIRTTSNSASSPATNVQKKSAATSPPRDRIIESRSSSSSLRANVSNTGTSPPPQSISTQTYEEPNSWERAPSASRSRPRRRLRDDSRRDRSHSRHSLSSDTRESDRSAHTSGGGRWEWRSGRDSSPAEYSGGGADERQRLTRRASHLDLRRAPRRRPSFYGSEAASPEPLPSSRTLSLEALAGAGSRRETERGLELARLMSDAERLGFGAAEVHAALAQSPAAPLSWLRERWPSLVAGVRAAAARLAGAPVAEAQARAALARSRGAMWPAVTDCVERYRRQVEAVGSEGRLRGRVWGSPAGADDDAAPPPPPQPRADYSSDEFEAPPRKFENDDWMYLPLDRTTNNAYDMEPIDTWNQPQKAILNGRVEEVAHKLKSLLIQAGVPSIEENILLKSLLADNVVLDRNARESLFCEKPQSIEFLQTENDFIDAYNALTRLSPLPNINQHDRNNLQQTLENVLLRSHQKSNVNEVNSNQASNMIENANKNNANSYDLKSNVNELNGNQAPNVTENANNNNFDNYQQTPKQTINTKDLKSDKNVLNEPSTSRKEDHSVPEVYEQQQISNPQEQIIPIEQIPESVNNGPHSENSVDTALPSKSNGNITQIPNVAIKEAAKEALTGAAMPSTSKINNKLTQETIKKGIGKIKTVSQENYRVEDDKVSNLSDIVDNTQRLIQQMKEEINSDINSLDERSVSHSEADNSSNGSEYSTEHESSYSESEVETDDLTSDENDSSHVEEGNEPTERSDTVLNRTSSEDNEQFEEAMDHIEEQNERVKQANLEILDSIARSLQEEHTMSIEVNQDQQLEQEDYIDAEYNQEIQPPIVPPTQKTKKRGDLNNNVFKKVSSFDEIMGQIETDNIQSSSVDLQQRTPPSPSPQAAREVEPAMIIERRTVIVERRDVLITPFVIDAPTQLIITDNKSVIYNATIEEIEMIEEEAEVAHESVNPVSNNIDAPENIDIITIVDQQNDQHHGLTDHAVVTGTDEDNGTENFVTKDIIENYHETHSATPVSTIIGIETNVNTPIQLEANIENDTSTNIVNTEEIDSPVKGKSQSPEKTLSSSNENSNNKGVSLNKSNIPKPVKTGPNSKQNANNVPKANISKVPVRRGSTKQNQAPSPPKTAFGNVQNGHVKQLQTQLFNNKTPKVTVNPKAIADAKASTSTLNKKRVAPLPPSKIATKQQSPKKVSPPKEKKKNFFRESCRTEDEWTDSDSGESQIQVERRSEEPQRMPSPPPPITMRRVSGQLIDLARVRLMEGSPERQARMLLAEGALESWDQAQLAVELVSRGAEPPAALLAALECADLPAALVYLHQDCELCASRFPEHEMVSMLKCTHRCCRECARLYFNVQITERSIADCVCPFCKEPDLESLPEDEWLEYFAHMDILLKTLLENDVHELFQRKLRDRTLARDPNFRWCVECSSGFFVHPKQKKLKCPECKSVSCATCRKPWSTNHEGLSCEQYAAWLEDNDPERSVAAVREHLKENGLECPRCKFKYSLSRGGCMHFTCTQCKFEFCYGCGKPFMMGACCGLSEYCARLGLHSHHPRNCLFYLRDKEPRDLQTLLQMNNVTYETEAPEGSSGRCGVQLQRETPAGLVDGTCGTTCQPGHAGLCQNHYLEYLSRLVRARQLDPLPLLGVDDLETLVRRAALKLPPRPYGSLEGLYKRALTEIVREKIPLD